MSFSFLWPMLLALAANTAYHISSKETDPRIDPFASLIISYGLSFLVCVLAFVVSSGGMDVAGQMSEINVATFTLAIGVAGVETGSIAMYKMGWDISSGPLICNIALVIILIFVGVLAFHESITLKTVMGIMISIAGLLFVNHK